MSRRWIPLALVAVASALVALHPVGDSDTFWHLTLGRAVAHAHARVVPEPVAFAGYAPTVVCAEWLWELIAYGLFRAGWFALLAWWLAVLAALAAVTTWLLATTARARAGSFAVPLVVTTLALLTIDSRMVLRPQSAYLVLLPLFVALTLRLVAAGRKRRIALGLVAVELVWAQLHGSFVLGPLVFAVAMATDASVRERTARRAHLLTLLGVGLAALTSAHGPGIVVYVLEHSGGDAVRHIADMRAPSWAELDPISPYALGFWMLALVALAGMVAARKIWWTGLALALLGLGLLLTAVRFVDAAVILMLPLAVRSADILAELPKHWQGWKWLAALASAGLMAWLLVLARGWWGPTGRTTEDPSKIPVAAIGFLSEAPPGNVLSTYEADAPLGFFLAGKDRVFVDGRTPLYFDSADYGVARDVWLDARALDLALRRYDVSAVVAPRDGELCRWMAARWPLAAVEPGFATFARAPKRTLTHLSACGDELLPRNACDDYEATRSELGAAPERLATLRTLSQIDLAARCHQPSPAPLPSLRAAWPWETEWRRAAARQALAEARPQQALDVLAPLVDRGDLVALSILRPAFNELPVHVVRAHLDAAVRALDDGTPPELRADLALACSAEGDAECVRFHGLRAAAHGVPTARAPLEWLAAHHPSERVRADARAWLLTLPEPAP